jgi:hypothetical protein
MGNAIARRLIDHGAQVLTSLAGRTIRRVQAAGMIDADGDKIAAADVILLFRRRMRSRLPISTRVWRNSAKNSPPIMQAQKKISKLNAFLKPLTKSS